MDLCADNEGRAEQMDGFGIGRIATENSLTKSITKIVGTLVAPQPHGSPALPE